MIEKFWRFTLDALKIGIMIALMIWLLFLCLGVVMIADLIASA